MAEVTVGNTRMIPNTQVVATMMVRSLRDMAVGITLIPATEEINIPIMAVMVVESILLRVMIRLVFKLNIL